MVNFEIMGVFQIMGDFEIMVDFEIRGELNYGWLWKLTHYWLLYYLWIMGELLGGDRRADRQTDKHKLWVSFTICLKTQRKLSKFKSFLDFEHLFQWWICGRVA